MSPLAGTAAPRQATGSTGGEPGPDTLACLRLYRRLAAGVTVVTSRNQDGPVGMTASAVTSISLHPPLLLACLDSRSQTLAGIQRQRTFAVQLLRADQAGWADAFAQPGREGFGEVRLRDVLGVPTLVDSLAWAVCLLAEARPYGDHHVVVGELVATHVATVGRPLLWHDSSYWTLGPVGSPAAGPP